MSLMLAEAPTTTGRDDVRIRVDDGVELAVHDIGPRDAAHTVVLLHGLCLNRMAWARQTRYLTERYGDSVRVISYDHRGHGRSAQAPMRTYRLDRLAQDLAQLLAALEVTGEVTLVGHSMGGMTALTYLGLSDRPVTPRGLVLVATAAGHLAAHGLGRLLATPATAALFGLVEHSPDVALRALAAPLCAGLGRWRRGTQSAAMAAVAVAALTTTAIPTVVGFLPDLRIYDQSAVLASVAARTVIVSGTADPLTPPAHAQGMAAVIPGAVHLSVPGAGHMLPAEAPHVVNEAIRCAMRMTSADGMSRAGAAS
jgi:pimeloyl-ACP methyl ester carboxylesterase